MKRVLRTVFLFTALGAGVFSSAVAAIVSETHSEVNCFGGNDGRIQITVSGGVAPYTYSWADGAVSQNRDSLAAGTYRLTVTDFSGVTDVIQITLSQPSALYTSFAITPVSCGGGNDGAIDLSVSGGTPGYSVLWSDGATTQDRSNITAANYYVTITDGKGCLKIDSANVTQPMGMVPSITSSPSNCNSHSGQINLTVQYGYPTYTYLWNDGATSEDRTALAPGTYSVTVTDQINCSVSLAATVNQVSGAMSVNGTTQNPDCYNDSSGKVTLTSIIGSIAPFSYSWSNGATGAINSGLSTGAYTVTVTSGTNCTVSRTFILTNPAPISITTTAIPISCYGANNGAITTSVSGGEVPYSFNWENGIYTQNRMSLAPGAYSVIVTDNNGCTATASDTITQPLKVVVNTTTSPLACSGGATGSVFTTVSGGVGGYAYWWGSGITSPDRINVNSGTYTVTVTDANGCSAAGTGNIPGYTPLALSLTPSNVDCYGATTGAVNLSVNNGLPPYSYLWSSFDTLQDVTGLSAGTYSVIVTDNHACTATKSVTLTQPSFPITINGTVADVTCNGAANGTISLGVLNAVAPYSFAWADGGNTPNRNALNGGNYTVTVTDGKACTAVAAYDVQEPAPLLLSVVKNDAACWNTQDGYVHLNVANGFAPYSYLWNDGAAVQNRDSLLGGVYTVTVSDMHLCSATASATVAQPTPAGLSLTATDVTCYGAADGAVSLSLADASSYTYLWQDGNTSKDRLNLAAGVYSVTATNSAGCAVSASATVQQPPLLQIAETHSDESCGNAANGSATVAVSGGAAPYSFAWSTGSLDSSIHQLAAGSYTVTITDGGGCTAVQSVTIQQGSSLMVTETHTDATCFGASDAHASVAVSGGTTPYTFAWSDGNSNALRTGLSQGTYTVVVSDAHACSAQASVVIAQPDSMQIVATPDAVHCYGTSTGSIAVNVSGGLGSYTYLWSDGSSDRNRANLTAGSYTLTVADAGHCTAVKTMVIATPDPLLLTVSADSVSCFGGDNGGLSLNVSGGSGAYHYQWNNGATTAALTHLSAGVYGVTVSDDHACSAAISTSVFAPAAISIYEVVIDAACAGSSNGQIHAQAAGGAANYTYLWGSGDTTSYRTNLTSGTYTLTVFDAHNCTATKTIRVDEPATLALSLATLDAGCQGMQGGAIQLTANGGAPAYQYSWSNGASTQNITNLTAGLYSVTVADAQGCTAVASAQIHQPATLQVALTATAASCFGAADGAVTATVSGGSDSNYVYQWSNAAITKNITGLLAGSYVLTVSDAGGCQTTASAQVAQPAVITITETHQQVSCLGSNDGSIATTVSGGDGNYLFAWSNTATSPSLSGLAAGHYSLTVTDGHQCTAQTTVVLVKPSPVHVSETHTDYACAGSEGTIQVSAAGGTLPYSWQWADGAVTTNRTQLQAGTYAVTVTDAHLCTATKTIMITALDPLVSSLTKTDAACYGTASGSATLNVSGGTAPYHYAWNTGDSTAHLAHITAGNYDVLITDANQCATTNSIIITQPAALTATYQVEDVRCFGGTDGKATVTPAAGTAPYAYLWSNAATASAVSGMSAGVYSVTITDADACATTVTGIVIQQPLTLTVNTSTAPTGCVGNSGEATATVLGGTLPYRYQWSTGDTISSLRQLPEGAYQVSVSDSHGCTTVQTAVVSAAQPLVLQAEVKNASCPEVHNGAIDLHVSGGSAPLFQWSNGSSGVVAQGLPIGDYRVTVSDANGCTAEGTYHVGYEYELTAQATATAVSGQSVLLSVQADEDHANSYTWSPALGLSCATCQETTVLLSSSATYGVTVSDENGCRTTDSVFVALPEVSPLFVPNAFTPNGDGNNDVLQVYGDLGSVRYFDFKVFNRWGEKMFESNSPDLAWDGIYRGAPAESGVYIYLLKVIQADGAKSDYKGSITLLR